MGVTRGWEASEKTSYGLVPFVFDPGEVKTQETLVKEAQQRIQSDKLLKKILGKGKGDLVRILQDCLDKVNDQLERGEDICRKAHFPLLHPFNFEDLEALAQHDFSIDIHADVVDKLLKDLVSEFLAIVWNNVAVEDVSKARMLERYNEALKERMETLEYHLIDRSKQLSNCRFAYFLEISHLRNQVYIKGIEGENFEPVEAYFFDPTDHLEEELRLQLNEKITMSVRLYHDKLMTAQRRIEDLEMQLETAGGAWRAEKKHRDKLSDSIEQLVADHKTKRILDELNKQEEREVKAWCTAWAEKHGFSKDEASGQEGGETRCEKRQHEIDMERLREALSKSQESLDEEREARRVLAEEMEEMKKMRDGAGAHGPDSKSQDEIEFLKKKISELRTESEKASQRAAAAEQELSAQSQAAESSRLALSQLQTQYDRLEQSAKDDAGKAPLVISSMGRKDTGRDSTRSDDSGGAGKGKHPGYDEGLAALEGLHRQYLDRRSTNTPTSFGRLGNIAGIGLTSEDASPQSGVSDKSRSEKISAILGDIDLSDEDLQNAIPEGSSNIHDYVQWTKALMEKKDMLLQNIEARLLDLSSEVDRQVSLAADERLRSEKAEAEATRLAEEAAQSHAARAAAEKAAAGHNADKSKLSDASKDDGQGAQTQITGSWGGGFYLLDFPPADAQVAMETELEDLNRCGLMNWEATTATVTSCQRPPLGYGSGFCPRSTFIRLFEGTRGRISRMDQLIQMAEHLKRAELLRVLRGMHQLMESTEPNEDVQLREAIFGRGISENALVAAKTGTELMQISHKWCSHAARVSNILLQRTDDIELGVHLGRRTFMVGGGGSMRPCGGAAGGGLAARERKDFSPSRQALWPWVLDQEDEVHQLQGLSNAVYLSPRSRAWEMGGELSLEGQEIPLVNLDGNTYGMAGFDSRHGPYITVAGRLMPRGSVERFTQHGYIPPSARGSPSRGNSPTRDAQQEAVVDLSVNARSWQPDVFECPQSRPRSSSRQRDISPTIREDPSHEDDRSSRQPSPSGAMISREQVGKSMSLTGTTLASSGDWHRVDKGLVSVTDKNVPSSVHEPEEDPMTGLDEAGAKVIARLRPTRGGSVTTPVVQPTLDIEEPQAEPAPSCQVVNGLPRPWSGFSGRGLKGYDRRDREVERARRQMCDSSSRNCGPMPTWTVEQAAENQRPRTAGGRHTKAPQALKRVASAGKLRSAPAHNGVLSSSASAGAIGTGLPSGLLAPRPGTAPGSRSATTGVRQRPATASCVRSGEAESLLGEGPAVRITRCQAPTPAVLSAKT